MVFNTRMVLIPILATLLLTPVIRISAASFELSYDDGDSDYGWSDFYPMAAAVKFTPPSAGWRLKAVRVHAVCFLRGYANFYVQVWDSSLNTVYWSTFTFSQIFNDATLDWYTIKLPNVVVAGEFYVVIVPMFTLDGPQLWMSVDDDPPVSNTSFIINVDERAIMASLNATSGRPGSFMIRVVGEPAPPPLEIRLTSIEVNEDETVVCFSFPGEFTNVYARLFKQGGTVVEQNVTLRGLSLVVRVREQGILNIYVVTPNSELVGTSVKLGGNLRTFYNELLLNFTMLRFKAEAMQRQVDSLTLENERLRISVRDMNYSILTLQNHVSVLMDNLTSQKQQVAELNESIECFRRENRVLLSLLVVAVAVPMTIVLLKRLRAKRK